MWGGGEPPGGVLGKSSREPTDRCKREERFREFREPFRLARGQFRKAAVELPIAVVGSAVRSHRRPQLFVTAEERLGSLQGRGEVRVAGGVEVCITVPAF